MGRIKDTSKLKSFNERAFGIEIEFVSKEHKNAVATLIESRANALLPEDNQVEVVSEGYNHNTSSYWKIVTDSSVYPNRAQRNNGYLDRGLELVSPIIKGEAGVAQIEAILTAMNQDNLCAINKSCGFHVHHDIRTWRDGVRSSSVEENEASINNLTNLITLVSKFEDVIYGMLPASRKNGSWCQPVNHRFDNVFQAMNGKSLEKRAKKVSYLKNGFKNHSSATFWQNSRYAGLNTMNFFKYGAVEFRYGSPTLNAEKMINWIVFTQCFVNMAETFKTINSHSEMKLSTKREVDLTFDKMRDTLGLSRRLCRDDRQRACALWIRKRFNHFNPDLLLF
tara:strand:+ start:531 stop:1541 length:1011 start_codon:yes stop_codon:yes gene_type:complete